jgi:hypothetical protein
LACSRADKVVAGPADLGAIADIIVFHRDFSTSMPIAWLVVRGICRVRSYFIGTASLKHLLISEQPPRSAHDEIEERMGNVLWCFALW